jgi:lysozyme
MINEAGLALLREYEGCRLQAYLDAGGIPTIGFGHTGPDVRLGQTCTQEQADAWLMENASAAADGVAAHVRVPLNENELSACSVFAFNVGVANFAKSSICRLINAGDKSGAARSFLLWDKARVNGQLVSLPGLQRRRAAEAHLFLTPCASPVSEPDSAVTPVSPDVPEETGISTVEAPAKSIGGSVTAGTAIATALGGAQQAVERIEPVKYGLEGMGLSAEYIAIALGVLVMGAVIYVGVQHFRAKRAFA